MLFFLFFFLFKKKFNATDIRTDHVNGPRNTLGVMRAYTGVSAGPRLCCSEIHSYPPRIAEDDARVARKCVHGTRQSNIKLDPWTRGGRRGVTDPNPLLLSSSSLYGVYPIKRQNSEPRRVPKRLLLRRVHTYHIPRNYVSSVRRGRNTGRNTGCR